MEDNNSRSSAQTAAELARMGKAIAKTVKAAAAGGVEGAAVTAAAEFAPELIRIAAGVLAALLLIPLVVIWALPNMFFGYQSVVSQDVSAMTQKAFAIGGTYYSLEQFEDTVIDSVVTGIAGGFEEDGAAIENIVVRNHFTEDDLRWFIAITAVANRQDLNAMSAEGIQSMAAARLHYSVRLWDTTLRVTISHIDPEEWMEQLGFDDEAKTWVRSLYRTLYESNALEEYADLYDAHRPSYAGDTGYSGAYSHGSGFENEIDISGFNDPATKNAHDLAAYVLQAWENNWGYVWGTYGNVLTQWLFDYKLEQFPDGVGDHETFIRENWLDRRTADCVGLIKGYGWLDTESLTLQYGTNSMPDCDADQMYGAAVTGGYGHGPINTMPEIPGLGLWKNGHVGVYIGGGYAIEAMGTKYGVVKTEVAGRGWEEWFKIPYIEYDTVNRR